MIQKNNSIEDIISWISQFKSDYFFSLKNLFISFNDTLNELSLNLNKKIILKVPNWDIYMDNKISISLSEAFTHSL